MGQLAKNEYMYWQRDQKDEDLIIDVENAVVRFQEKYEDVAGIIMVREEEMGLFEKIKWEGFDIIPNKFIGKGYMGLR